MFISRDRVIGKRHCWFIIQDDSKWLHFDKEYAYEGGYNVYRLTVLKIRLTIAIGV